MQSDPTQKVPTTSNPSAANPARTAKRLRWLTAAALALLLAAAGWLVVALIQQEQVLQQLDNRAATGSAGSSGPRRPVVGEGASLLAGIPGALDQLTASPRERPEFFDHFIDLWFLCRLQNVSDDDFVTPLLPDLPRYLAVYAAQLKALIEHPDDLPVRPHDHFLRGLLRGVGAGQREGALADLTAAINSSDSHDSALHTRGRLYHELGRNEEAVADLRASLAINERRWSGWYHLARALDALGETAEADVAWEQAHTRCPADRRDGMLRTTED